MPACPSDVNVLLVDDEPGNLLALEAILAELGHNLVKVSSGEEALARLREQTYAVVLLDVREAGSAIKVPVILLTGQADRALDLEAMQAGAADFLVKGRIDAPMLERSIRYALERHRGAEALRLAQEELEARVATRTRELSEANSQLIEAGHRKDEFLAMLGHELRNPLAALRNVISIFQQSGIHPEALEQTQGILERQVGHLARMVDDLLDVSRILRGKVQVQRELLDLGALVGAACADYRAILAEAGLRLVLELPDAPVWVAGDATRLAQVLGNLLDNARKFIGAGSRVTVRLAVAAQENQAEKQAILTVRDDGSGIEPALLPHIFDSFTQGDRSLDRARGGLGLGLAVVKGLVDPSWGAHRGRQRGSRSGRGVHGATALEGKAAGPDAGAGECSRRARRRGARPRH